jgi:hypothetical protein
MGVTIAYTGGSKIAIGSTHAVMKSRVNVPWT